MGAAIKKNKGTEVARIENWFVFNSQYSLSAKQQKIVLHLISLINPKEQTRFHEQVIRLADMKKLLITEGKKSGSFNEQLQKASDDLIGKQIKFPTKVKFQGQPLPGRINWFQSIVPLYNENGEACLEFLFSEKLKPFLLQLQEYAQIDMDETLSLTSGFSIRMFQIFRAHRDKVSKYRKNSEISYTIEELKKLLGIVDKYNDWRNLKRKVLDILTEEITNETSIKVSYESITQGRKTIGVKFLFHDRKIKSKPKKSLIADLQRDDLSFAQSRAFNLLTETGIHENISLGQIIPKLNNIEWQGFEDVAVELMVKMFNDKARAKNGGTFVNWFLKLKIFEQGDNFAKVMEHVQAYKKNLAHNHPERWDNRQTAKNMTAVEFRKLHISE